LPAVLGVGFVARRHPACTSSRAVAPVIAPGMLALAAPRLPAPLRRQMVMATG
jgi:hypothetical protein